jgi:hypothetical protein
MTALLRALLSPLIVPVKCHRMLFAPEPAEYGEKECSKYSRNVEKKLCVILCVIG